MASVIEYSNNTSMILDLNLWLAQHNSEAFNLGQFPTLAKDRWTWIIDNWVKVLYPRFKVQANGDEYLEGALVNLDNNVKGWKSGSNVNPYANIGFFSSTQEFLSTIQLSELILTNAENIYVQQEVQRIRKFTSESFNAMVRYLRSQRDLAFDLIGLGSSFYSEKFAKRSMVPKQRNFFIEDLLQINRSIDIENFILGIIIELKKKSEIEPNLLAIANNNISGNSDQIDIRNAYQSYITIPFEQSLEQMAADYLGDTQRWFELVTVNGLKPPFLDITGEKAFLLETASSNSLRISSSYADRTRVGATVKIGSVTVPEEIRMIESVTDNQDGSVTLYLSGSTNLRRLEAAKKAYVRVFKPETLQDFSFVKIPLSVQGNLSSSLPPTISALKNLDKALFSFGVDLALDERTGDIAISNVGDLKLQYGIPNIRQAVARVLSTDLTQLPLHPDYGTPDKLGDNMLGAPTANKIAATIEDVIKRDPRFTLVQVDNISFTESGANMNLNVGINGTTALIPLSFVL